eukprot:Seg254.1 transcript_id=Seg254.1/GoldUCD/mRNA.D3Y31 product="hypothetical protein" protein_id=Seg254.1/GoldUCD/D3Y31
MFVLTCGQVKFSLIEIHEKCEILKADEMAFVTIFIFAILAYGSSLVDAATNCNKVVCGSFLEHCINNGTHDRCECLSAYYRPTGSALCKPDCEPSYCYNKGTCERGPNGRVCRCVSPYSGVRCGNERTISIQIAVGSSIMAVVLVVSLCLIVRNNMRHGEKRKEKHGWDEDLEAELARAENEHEEVAGNEIEAIDGSKHYDEIAQPTEPTAHNDIQSPPKYETVADINNIKAEKGSDDKSPHADAPHAYANAAAEASDGEDDNAAEESAL